MFITYAQPIPVSLIKYDDSSVLMIIANCCTEMYLKDEFPIHCARTPGKIVQS